MFSDTGRVTGSGLAHGLAQTFNTLFGWTGLHFARGGVVPRYQMGGGVDSVLGWLTPGEGIVTEAGMAGIGGPAGLQAINQGAGGGAMTIQPSPVYVLLDGRMVSKALIQYTLSRAARGPSSLIGGSLATGRATTP